MADNYIERVAREIHDEVSPSALPDGDVDTLFLMYAVLLFAKGEFVGRSDVHNAWSAWMTSSKPGHESIEPYSELPDDVKDEDGPFVAAIRKVARRAATRRSGT